MSLLVGAAIAFGFAAILGVFLLAYVLRGKPTPKGVAFIHGPLGAVGIVLLLVSFTSSAPAPVTSVVLFVLAAIGGFFLLYRDLVHGSVPKTVALVHGGVAVVAFLILLRALLA